MLSSETCFQFYRLYTLVSPLTEENLGIAALLSILGALPVLIAVEGSLTDFRLSTPFAFVLTISGDRFLLLLRLTLRKSWLIMELATDWLFEKELTDRPSSDLLDLDDFWVLSLTPRD